MTFDPHSPAAVAVSVLRDGLRPQMPEGDDAGPAEYADIITNCWHTDPSVRPTFLEVMTRLATMIEGHGTNSSSSMTSKDRSRTTSRRSHEHSAKLVCHWLTFFCCLVARRRLVESSLVVQRWVWPLGR